MTEEKNGSMEAHKQHTITYIRDTYKKRERQAQIIQLYLAIVFSNCIQQYGYVSLGQMPFILIIEMTSPKGQCEYDSYRTYLTIGAFPCPHEHNTLDSTLIGPSFIEL